MGMRKGRKILLCLCVLAAGRGVHGQEVTIVPAAPTHFFYTPAAYVNPPWHLVVGLHEISFAFPGNLQVQLSLVDNIGRINFGAKYGILDRLSVGAGLAHTVVHFGYGDHGIPNHARPRLGVFLCYGTPRTGAFEWSVTAHTQIGDHVSVGGDFGLMATPSDWWSFIFEIGTSVDLMDALLWVNADGGIRVHPPSVPFLYFDAGVDLAEFPVKENPGIGVSPYFDVIFAMETR
ncbi:MAG: hypothetical protein GF418_00915 [Chitinivibrionales bacterium]|nr:hypothetical protein [Chitinivibrionales bacterium]MBD3394162.1 hypothetical protein [Chitinivibrionales bacterium]